MSTAPGVLVEFKGVCPVWTFATRGLATGISAGLLSWAVLHHLNGQDPVLAWLVTGITVASLAVLAWLLRQPLPQGRLVWNNRGWCWHAGEPASAAPMESGRIGWAHIALDLGDWVLLRFDDRPESNTCRRLWLPLSRARAGGNWHALQCALRQTADSTLGSGNDPFPRAP